MIFVLVTACGNEQTELSATVANRTIEFLDDSEIMDDTQRTELGIQIALATDELLSSFGYHYGFDYTHIREARDGGEVEYFNGDTLVIWADVPLRDLAVLFIDNDAIDGEVIFIPIQRFDITDILIPGQALVISSYVGFGTLPWSGISFVDENDEMRYFWMIRDESIGFDPNIFDHDILYNYDYEFENGQLQVAIVDGRGEREYITITKDESGRFDPDRWLEDNKHIWVRFILGEFEGRIGEE